MKEIQTIGVVGAGPWARHRADRGAGRVARAPVRHQRGSCCVGARSAAPDLGQAGAEGQLGAADAQAALERVVAAGALSDMADCQLVVEAIVERLDVKRDLFAALEGVVAEDASWLRTRPRCPSPPSLRPASARSAWPVITSSTRWR